MRSARSRSIFVLTTGVMVASLAVGGPAIAKGPGSGGGGGGSGGHHGTGGTTGGGGTISLAQLVKDVNGDGLPNWGDTVTFNVSTTATDQPWVNLKCSQNGVVVAQGWNGYFVGSLTGRDFGLYSGYWSGGAADCTAYLTNPQWTVLASTSFQVYA